MTVALLSRMASHGRLPERLQDLRYSFVGLGSVRVGTRLLVPLCDVFFFSKAADEKLTFQEEQSAGPVGSIFSERCYIVPPQIFAAFRNTRYII